MDYSLRSEREILPNLNWSLNRKQEGLVDELKKKDQEVESLKQKLHHMVALHSTWTPSLSSPHHWRDRESECASHTLTFSLYFFLP